MVEIKYPIVDNNDNVIGKKTKEEAYRQGLQLRSIQIFLFDSKNRLFIQKRSSKKDRFPNYFCASVAGHVEPGETYLEAAKRELKEELGVEGELKFLSKEKTPIDDRKFAMMSHFTAKTDQQINLQEEEVDDGGYYTIDEIDDLIHKSYLFTPSFLYYFNKIKKGNL